MALTWHGFGEDIDNLQSSGDMWKGDNLMIICFSDGVTVNLDVLGAFVIDGVGCNLDGTCVVSMQWSRMKWTEPKLCEETTQPNDLGARSRHGAILCLSG